MLREKVGATSVRDQVRHAKLLIDVQTNLSVEAAVAIPQRRMLSSKLAPAPRQACAHGSGCWSDNPLRPKHSLTLVWSTRSAAVHRGPPVVGRGTSRSSACGYIIPGRACWTWNIAIVCGLYRPLARVRVADPDPVGHDGTHTVCRARRR